MTLLATGIAQEDRPRLRDLGIKIGIFKTGGYNAITDVQGVLVGHHTLISGDSIRTGVTAIRPHTGNIFQEKVPAAVYVANGFGKLAGLSQVNELGNIESPIILTNTLSVAAGIEGVLRYTLANEENKKVRSVNAVVGETNDGFLNDIRGRHIQPEHVIAAIEGASSGPVEEGAIGAGTGTICFGYKGGIGTSSRVLPAQLGGYTVGVLVQSNFGGVLEFAGVPVAKDWEDYPYRKAIQSADGSCMIVVATDAPLDHRNLTRLAKRAFLGIAKTGGFASNGSGDYIIAFSTHRGNRIPYQSDDHVLDNSTLVNRAASPLFQAVLECTEEAILNSLLQATTTSGMQGTIEKLPIEKLKRILQKYGRVP